MGGRVANNRFYCSRNLQKTNTTFEEGSHCYFVGRVQRDCLAPPNFDCFISQT